MNYDGLAWGRQIVEETAPPRCSGRKLILLTGRELPDLRAIYPLATTS